MFFEDAPSKQIERIHVERGQISWRDREKENENEIGREREREGKGSRSRKYILLLLEYTLTVGRS